MGSVLRVTWALFLGLLIIMMANGLQGVLLAVRGGIEFFSTTSMGFVMSGYFAGFLFGAAITQRLVNNVGHVRVFAAMASLASVSAVLHATLVDPWSWTIMRILTGVSFAGIYIISESWLNDKATNATRGALLALYMVVLQAGAASGQMVLNVADPAGYDLFVICSVLVSLALIPLLLSASPAPAIESPKKITVRELYRASPLGAVGVFMVGSVMASVFGISGIYATQEGFTLFQVSLFSAMGFVGAMVFQYPMGWLSDRFDRRLVLTVASAAAGGLAVLCFVIADSLGFYVIMGLFVVYVGMAMPQYAIAVAHTNDHLEKDQMVGASSTMYIIAGVGSTIGPIAASYVMDMTDAPRTYFAYLAMLHAALLIFALYRMTRRAAMPLDEQGPSVPFTHSGTVASTMIAEEYQEALESEEGAPAPDELEPVPEPIAAEDYAPLESDKEEDEDTRPA